MSSSHHCLKHGRHATLKSLTASKRAQRRMQLDKPPLTPLPLSHEAKRRRLAIDTARKLLYTIYGTYISTSMSRRFGKTSVSATRKLADAVGVPPTDILSVLYRRDNYQSAHRVITEVEKALHEVSILW